MKKINNAIVSFVFVLLVIFLFLAMQRYNDYKLKTNLTAFQKSEMQTTVDNYINIIDYMRKDLIANYEKNGLEYSEDDIKEEVLKFLRQIVHEADFANGAYLWVNEVLKYSGGDNYAIRQVHGNLPETEGMYLSTAMEDAVGNLPYLKELNGIKEKGELIYKYYFKEYHSDNVSEKITYAKLYEPYNWIVCTGTYLNSMYEPAGGISKKNNLIFMIFCMIILLFSLGMFLHIIAVTLIKSRKLMKETESLKVEVATDNLTGAGSRAYGVSLLTECLNNYNSTGRKYAVAIFDVDDFKSINDRYGHYVGDDVLKNFVETVKKNLTDNMYLIRWGGDEFILIYTKEDSAIEPVLDKLNKKIASSSVTTEIGVTVKYTVSIGASYIASKDKAIKDIIKRIDDALYLAKRNKNSFYVIE